MKDIVIISDLHLMPQQPETITLFLRFCREIAARADALYILGDFLEAWWGDDNPATDYQPAFDALATLATEDNTDIYLMHGNRDFLIGEALAKQCHFKIIDDPYKIQLNGHDILLMHGDTLCTDDIDYQQFRQMVRDPAWQQQFLSKTLEERGQIAHAMREKSRQSTAEKSEYIMDVNQQETDRIFIENDVDTIIHGHTHRPAVHRKNINGHDTTRVVLGDWHDKGSYLLLNDSDELKLRNYG